MFVERKNDCIQIAWTTALEEKRGQAVNPAWNGLYGPATIE